MRMTTEQFETGWCDIRLVLSETEIDALCANLQGLKQDSTYVFHVQSDFQEEGPGIANLTVVLGSGDQADNASMYPEP